MMAPPAGDAGYCPKERKHVFASRKRSLATPSGQTWNMLYRTSPSSFLLHADIKWWLNDDELLLCVYILFPHLKVDLTQVSAASVKTQMNQNEMQMCFLYLCFS